MKISGNNKIKLLLTTILPMLLITLLSACAGSSQVRGDVKRIAADLPIDIGYGLTITQLDYDADTVRVRVLVSENTVVPFEQLRQTAPEMSETLVEDLSKIDNADLQSLLSDCHDANAVMCFDFHNFDNQTFSLAVSPDKL